MMKTILVITVVVAFFVAGYCIAYSRMQIKYDELYVKYLNQQAVNHTVSIWLKEKVRRGNVSWAIQDIGSKRIAVYGIGILGEYLIEELRKQRITIVYIVDRKEMDSQEFQGIKVYHPNEPLPEADLVIVTAVFYFDDIAFELKKKVSCPIVSLEEIINVS